MTPADRDPLLCPLCGGDWADRAAPYGDQAGDPLICALCDRGVISDADLLRDVLTETAGGNVSALSRLLHVSRSQIHRWLRQGDALDLSPRMRELVGRHAKERDMIPPVIEYYNPDE